MHASLYHGITTVFFMGHNVWVVCLFVCLCVVVVGVWCYSRISVRLQWSLWAADGGALVYAGLRWGSTCRSQTHVSRGAGEGPSPPYSQLQPCLWVSGRLLNRTWMQESELKRCVCCVCVVCVCVCVCVVCVCVCVCFPGITHTMALWKSLLTLLQDEDQDVREGAADFTFYIPAHLHNTGTHTHMLVFMVNGDSP